MSNKKQWAVIILLATLNLQHINLKEEFGELRLKVRTIENFLDDKLGFKKQQEKNNNEQS